MDGQSLIGKKVRVYWNSRGRCFSVLSKGKVIAHRYDLVLAEPKPIISKAGQAKVRLNRRKNVHAYIEGVVVKEEALGYNYFTKVEVTYDPYKDDSFVVHYGSRVMPNTDKFPEALYMTTVLNRPTMIGIRLEDVWRPDESE